MKQQVNLYKSLPRISRNWFGETVVFQITAAFLVLLFLVTIVQFIMLQWEKFSVNSLQKKFIESNARFSKEQKAQGGVDLVQLQQELASKTQLLKLLHVKTEAEGSCPLLSDYFRSFSTANSSGLWLTRFIIAPDTRDLTLEGMTYEPLIVVHWVKELAKTPCFSGIQYQTIEVQKSQDEANKNLMLFNIGSSHAPTPGGKK